MVTVWQTRGDAEAMARSACGRDAGDAVGRFDVIVASGGDGTINEVVNGLLADDTEAALGEGRTQVPVEIAVAGARLNVLGAEARR